MADACRKPLAVYIHFPFCVKKCAYCDFLSFPLPAGAAGTERRERFFHALLAETAAAVRALPGAPSSWLVQTIYFGGGTPSLALPAELGQVLDALGARLSIAEDAEITMECNPGTATREKLRDFRACGINRLSIGVQSFDDRELRILGRIHTAAQAEECVRAAGEAGFDNISLDLMAALPGQHKADLLSSVEHAIRLAPEHLSLYSLIIEPETPFYERYGDAVADPHYDRAVGAPGLLPDEDEEREMLHAAWERLLNAGYVRYEISNFARTGDADLRSRHNLVYWNRGDYLGLGPGAASLIDETRFSNTRDTERYLEAASKGDDMPETLREQVQKLDTAARMEETMFLGLRLAEGVSERRFADTFHTSVDAVYGPQLARLTQEGLLARRDGRVFLTGRGTDLSNMVMSEFLF